MDQICTNLSMNRNVTTIPDVCEVKRGEHWVVGDFRGRKRKRECSSVCSEFWKGNYSFSLLSSERDKDIVSVAIIHQENVDPRFLVESLGDPNKRRCNVSPTRWTEDDDDDAVENRPALPEAIAVKFKGLFCFVKHSKILSARASVLKLPLSQKGLYKVEYDNKTIGVAIDPTDVFGDAKLSSTLLYDSRYRYFRRYAGRCTEPHYAVALHKTVNDVHVPGSIRIDSVLYGNLKRELLLMKNDFYGFIGDVYRSFYNSGEHIENPHYCFDATMDGSDFSILPDNVFVKILLYLPWIQRIVSRRVNKRWMKLCSAAISIDTKVIRWDSKLFRRMDDGDLWRLLPIVCGGLEEIEWPNLCRSLHARMLHQIPAFRNLRSIDMHRGILDYKTFFSFLDKCPNLRELRARIPIMPSANYSPGTYPVEKMILPSHTLANCEIELSNDHIMEIISRFPRLSYLQCEDIEITSEGVLAVIGQYGENLVHLQICCMYVRCGDADITGMEKCHNLEYLELSSADFLSDAVMKDIANGCQKLRTLVITNCDNVTNEGLTALASLPNLKQLNISDIEEEFSFGISQIKKDFSLGISQIAKEGRLEQLIARCVDLSPMCLKACVRYCRQLKLLDVKENSMADGVTLEDAKEIIHLFNGWRLSPCLVFRTRCQVWKDSEINQLREEQKKSGQRQFVVHFVFCYTNRHHGFIPDDDSISSHYVEH